MFAQSVDPEVWRLVAAAPGWPTLDDLWDECPPTAPDGDDEHRPAEQHSAPTGVPVEADPSGWLALDLDVTTADSRALSDAAVIDALAGFGRMQAWAQARQVRLVAEFDRRRSGSAARWAPDEISLALSISRFAAVGRVAQARRLVDTLTDTLELFERGRVDGYKVRLICDAVRLLDDAQAVWVQDRVLPRAPEQSPAQLRAALARAVIAADPEGANDRHRKARKDRRVGVGAEDDGMSSLWAYLSAQDTQQVFGTLTGLARRLGAEDPRGMDARRADLLVGLLTGALSIAHARPDADRDDQHHMPDDNDSATVADSAEPDSVIPGGDSSGGNPAASDPAASDPAASDPAASDPAASDPAASDPAVSDPAANGPAGGNSADRGPAHGADPEFQVDPTACPVCAAQAWLAARPALRPVSPNKPLVQVVMAHSTLRGADHDPAELVGHGAICADQAREIAADAVWRRLVYDDESGAVLDHGRTTYRPPAALADFVRARDVHCRSPLCRRRALDCELDHTVPFPIGPTAAHNLTDGCVLHHHEKHAPGWTVLQHPDGSVDWITPTGHTYAGEVHDYRPLPPPPLPIIPGPIADRSEARPRSVAPPPRPVRFRYDWSADGSDDPVPF